MLKFIAAVLFAALIADVTFNASAVTGAFGQTAPRDSLKGDKLQLYPVRSDCVQAAWPYYEAGCVRGRMTPTVQPREIRVVAIDRLPAQQPAASTIN